MNGRDRTIAISGGLAAGSFGGLFGVGGGVLLVPILTNALRRTQHEAHGTSLATIGATALAGVVVYGLHGALEWRTALLAGPSCAICARLGARTASRLSTRHLRLGFSVMLAIVAVRMLLKGAGSGAPLTHLGPFSGVLVDVVVGGLAGFVAGLMGVGGGIVAVPAFTLLFGMTQQQAQGTSLALILFSAPAGAWEHSRRGNVVLELALWLGIGSLVGSWTASALVQTAPAVLLRRAFGVFLLLNAIPMGIRAWRSGRPSAVRPGAGNPPGPAVH